MQGLSESPRSCWCGACTCMTPGCERADCVEHNCGASYDSEGCYFDRTSDIFLAALSPFDMTASQNADYERVIRWPWLRCSQCGEVWLTRHTCPAASSDEEPA